MAAEATADIHKGLAGVVVDMVDEDWLAEEGSVGLLELLGRPPVEVLVDTSGDGSDLGVNLADSRLPVREDVELMEVEVSESLLGEDRRLLGAEPLGGHFASAHSVFLEGQVERESHRRRGLH